MESELMRRQFLAILVLVVANGIVGSGCGDSNKAVKATGSVTMGGQPQEGVRVTFIPNPVSDTIPPAGAVTGADGKFTIDVQPGNYKVTLARWVDKDGKVPGASDDPTQDFTQLMESGALRQVLPPQYADPASTPLSAEVPPEGKDLDPFAIDN